MTVIKRQELPIFGDMMANLFEDRFFDPIKKFNTKKVPSVNISENKDGFGIQLAAPGMKKEDFNVEIENNLIIISAEHKNETDKKDDNYSIREFNYSSFKRTFTLPKSADKTKIEAKYNAGILEVSIAKKGEELKESKRIEIA